MYQKLSSFHLTHPTLIISYLHVIALIICNFLYPLGFIGSFYVLFFSSSYFLFFYFILFFCFIFPPFLSILFFLFYPLFFSFPTFILIFYILAYCYLLFFLFPFFSFFSFFLIFLFFTQMAMSFLLSHTDFPFFFLF